MREIIIQYDAMDYRFDDDDPKMMAGVNEQLKEKRQKFVLEMTLA